MNADILPFFIELIKKIFNSILWNWFLSKHLTNKCSRVLKHSVSVALRLYSLVVWEIAVAGLRLAFGAGGPSVHLSEHGGRLSATAENRQRTTTAPRHDNHRIAAAITAHSLLSFQFNKIRFANSPDQVQHQLSQKCLELYFKIFFIHNMR